MKNNERIKMLAREMLVFLERQQAMDAEIDRLRRLVEGFDTKMKTSGFVIISIEEMEEMLKPKKELRNYDFNYRL